MARFTIYSKNGQTTRYSGTPTYHGTHLKVGYVEFREIASPALISWQVGDYVDYTRTGFRYRLYTLPQPTKQAVSAASGESFVYKDVQFYAATKDLEIAPFRDLVISDNTIHFTTLPSVATYEDVYGIARRIQANLDSFYGEGEWVIRVVETYDLDLLDVLTTTKEFSLSGGSCIDALNLIYSQWKGIGWVYSVENGVNTITIGRPNVQDADNTTSVFAYGLDNGLRVIGRQQSGKSDFATRLYAYGSTRNLIARYYNNLTPAIKDAQSVYIPNLMIPPSYWGETDNKKDARKAYLEAGQSVLDEYGLRQKTVYFDGTGDYEEIFPSVEGMTAGEIRAAMLSSDTYYPNPAYAADQQRVDEVVSAVNPSDNGVMGEDDGKKYAQTVTLSGTAQQRTITINPGQESARSTFDPLAPAGSISYAGEVRVTPSITGTITSTAALGALSLRIYLEIAGEKFGDMPVKLTRGVGNEWSLSMEPYTVTTDKTGQLKLKGYLVAAPTNRNSGATVSCSFTIGATLEVKGSRSDTFKVVIRQTGFDISKQESAISDGLCTISFKTGWCAGRDFTVKKCNYVAASDRWELTVARQSDESIGQYFPNSVYAIAPGDRFILQDLVMPEIYITAAQQRLYARANEVLASMSKPRLIYEPEIDAKILALSPEKILEGMYMPLKDDDVVDGGKDWILIDSIEIDEGAAEIPTYRITLQDEKPENFIAKLTREAGRNSRNITDITLTDLRTVVEETTPSTVEEEPVSVRVEASHPIIGYEHSFEEPPVNEVVLTCYTTGIDAPTYQWYFLGVMGWVAITGATGQSYTVVPNGSLYYLNGEIVEDFRCVVSADDDLSDQVQIMKVLSNAVTVSLSNPAHIFAAGVRFAEAAEDRTDVLGYRGVERFPTVVKMSSVRFLDYTRTPLTPTYSGGKLKDSQGKFLTDSQGKSLVTASGNGASISDSSNHVMMTVEVEGNGTTAAYLKITVTTYLDIPAGVIEVPVVIREADTANSITEKVVNLYYSWGLALQGNTAFTSTVFKRSASQPATPTGGDFDHPVPTGWSDGIPDGTDTLWMSMRIFSANGFYPQQATWSTPTGAYDTADLDFEYSAEETIPTSPNTGYDPSHDFPSPNTSWHNDPTSADIWMAMRKKSGGVWGDWEILKVKGEKGESPLLADIDNEMDGIGVGTDAVLDVDLIDDPTHGIYLALHTTVHLWYGSTAETITSITPDVPDEFDPALHSNKGIHVTANTSTGAVKIEIDAGTDFSDVNAVEIPIYVVSAKGGRTVTYTILPIKEGKDGSVFKLVASVDTIQGTYDANDELVYSVSGISCQRMARTGDGDMSTSSYGVLKMSVDGGTTRKAYAAITDTDTDWDDLIEAGRIIYYWYDDALESHMIDRETIPVVVDGEKGDDGAPGDFTAFYYAYSPNLTSSQSDGCPTNQGTDGSQGTPISQWSASTPTQASGQEGWYLWMKTVKMHYDPDDPNADAGGYVAGGITYARIGGDKGINGAAGKKMRGISIWTNQGYCGNSSVPYEGKNDATGEYYDVVTYEGLYYQCLYNTTTVSGQTHYATDPPAVTQSGQTTYNPCWELMNNYENIATQALAASQALINQLINDTAFINNLFANNIQAEQLETATHEVKIAGNQITVKDSNGNIVGLIHSGALSSISGGTGTTASPATRTVVGQDENAVVDVNILGATEEVEITSPNNVVSIPNVSVTASVNTVASGQVPDEWYVRRYATDGTTDIDIGTLFTFNSAPTSQTIPAIAVTLPVGEWEIIYEISCDIVADGQRITATTNMGNNPLTVAYAASGAMNEFAGNGFRAIWSDTTHPAQGFEATKNGAFVYQDGTAKNAMASSTAKGIEFVVPPDDYPASMEDGILYIKLTSAS